MSYVSKRGKAAAQAAKADNSTKQDVLKSFKSGTTYKVRLLTDADYVEYYAASVFKVFNTTPVGPDSLYKKAADLLYKDADKAETAGQDDAAVELRDQAYQIKPKPRYLFGFIGLDDGQPIIVDLSKKQAGGVISAIEKFSKKLDKVAFEISKTGSGQGTTVSLTPIIDMDEDLTDKQRENFAKPSVDEIPDDLFESVLKTKTDEEQAEDLRVFGFDVSRLGFGSESAPEDDHNVGEDSEDPTENF